MHGTALFSRYFLLRRRQVQKGSPPATLSLELPEHSHVATTLTHVSPGIPWRFFTSLPGYEGQDSSQLAAANPKTAN